MTTNALGAASPRPNGTQLTSSSLVPAGAVLERKSQHFQSPSRQQPASAQRTNHPHNLGTAQRRRPLCSTIKLSTTPMSPEVRTWKHPTLVDAYEHHAEGGDDVRHKDDVGILSVTQQRGGHAFGGWSPKRFVRSGYGWPTCICMWLAGATAADRDLYQRRTGGISLMATC